MEALVQTNNRGRLSIVSCDSGRAFATGLAEELSGIILEADGKRRPSFATRRKCGSPTARRKR